MTSARHVPALDGLRGIAVLLVLWDHAPQSIFPAWMREFATSRHPGGFGVDLFFVLSGFLITRILLAERESGVPVRYFLLRRALRIFPVYYLLLAALALYRPSADIAWCAVYLSNFTSSLLDASPNWLHHTWSLCVEEHFYSVWPLLVAFLPLRWSARLVGLVVIPGALLAGVVLVALPAIEPAWSWIGAQVESGRIDRFQRLGLVLFGTQCRVLSLAVGAQLAFHEERIRARPGRGVAVALLGLFAASGLSASTPALCAALGRWFDLPFPAQDWRVLAGVLATTLATSSTMLLVVAAEGWARSPLRWLSFAPLRAVGRISYGLYLYHLPLFQFLAIHKWGKQGDALRVWGIVAALFAVATLSYLLFERPILRFAARFRTAPRDRRTAAPQGFDQALSTRA